MNQENPPNPEEPAEHPPAIVPGAGPPAVVPEPVPPAVPAQAAVPAPSVAAPAVPGSTLASPTAVPVRPGAGSGRVGAGGAYALPRRSGNIRGLALLGLLVVAAWLLFFRPHANHDEQLARQVTVAIENNDMQPVEKYFTVSNRPELENKIRVARLSQDVSALGKLQSVKEDTAKDAPAGRHHFTETFERGSWVVDMTLDDDGKIAVFHIHPPAAP